MRSSTISILLGAASMASAIQITSPSKNDVVDLAAGVEVKWSTVNTDPDTAHLFLVNMASGHTPYSKDLGEVKLSTGSLLVSEKDVPEDGAFQFNFQSVKQNNMGILAQSEQFENKKEDGKDKDDGLVVDSTTTKATATTGGAKTTLTATTTAATAATTTGADAEETDDDDAEETTTSTGTASGTAAASTSTEVAESGATSVAVKGGMLALVAGVLAVVA